MCIECYSDNNRITPLLNPRECLEKTTHNIFVELVGDMFV